MPNVPQYTPQAKPTLSVATPMQNMNVSAAAFGYLQGRSMQHAGKSLRIAQGKLAQGAIMERRAEIDLQKRRGKAWAAETLAKLSDEYYDPENGLYAQNLKLGGKDAVGMTAKVREWFDKRSQELGAGAPNQYGSEYLTERLFGMKSDIIRASSRAEASASKKWEISAAEADMKSAMRSIAARASSMTDDELAASINQQSERAAEVARLAGLSEEGARDQFKADAYESVIDEMIGRGQLGKAGRFLQEYGHLLDAKDRATAYSRRDTKIETAERRAARAADKARRASDRRLAAEGLVALANGNIEDAQTKLGGIQDPSTYSRLATKVLDASIKEDAFTYSQNKMQEVQMGYATIEDTMDETKKVKNPVVRQARMNALKDEHTFFNNKKKMSKDYAMQEVIRFATANKHDPRIIQDHVDTYPVDIRMELRKAVQPYVSHTGVSPTGDVNVYMDVRKQVKGEAGTPIATESEIALAAKGALTYEDIKNLEKEGKNKATSNSTKELENIFMEMGGYGSIKEADKKAFTEFKRSFIQLSNGGEVRLTRDQIRDIAVHSLRDTTVDTNPDGWWGGDENLLKLGSQYQKAKKNADTETLDEIQEQWRAVLPELGDDPASQSIRKKIATPEGRDEAMQLATQRGGATTEEQKLELGARIMLKQKHAEQVGLPPVYRKVGN